MEDYPFAHLERSDVDDLKTLESKLTGKYGKNIILIAYQHGVNQEGSQALTALVDDDNPNDYGTVQSMRETGYRME